MSTLNVISKSVDDNPVIGQLFVLVKNTRLIQALAAGRVQGVVLLTFSQQGLSCENHQNHYRHNGIGLKDCEINSP